MDTRSLLSPRQVRPELQGQGVELGMVPSFNTARPYQDKPFPLGASVSLWASLWISGQKGLETEFGNPLRRVPSPDSLQSVEALGMPEG